MMIFTSNKLPFAGWEDSKGIMGVQGLLSYLLNKVKEKEEAEAGFHEDEEQAVAGR